MMCPLGTIPHTIGKMTRLAVLWLHTNQLSGDDDVVVVIVSVVSCVVLSLLFFWLSLCVFVVC